MNVAAAGNRDLDVAPHAQRVLIPSLENGELHILGVVAAGHEVQEAGDPGSGDEGDDREQQAQHEAAVSAVHTHRDRGDEERENGGTDSEPEDVLVARGVPALAFAHNADDSTRCSRQFLEAFPTQTADWTPMSPFRRAAFDRSARRRTLLPAFTGVPARTGVTARTGAAALVLVLGLSACASDDGLRVESTRVDPAGLGSDADGNTPGAPDPAPSDEPYDADRIREAVLDTDDTAADYTQVRAVVAACEDCLELSDPLVLDSGDMTFQVALVHSPVPTSQEDRRGNSDDEGDDEDERPRYTADEDAFAGVVIGQNDGDPEVRLVVSGHGLTLTPGRHGTLVAQEKVYREGDPSHQPSGWSVQVYRYQDGRFEAGQRISQVEG